MTTALSVIGIIIAIVFMSWSIYKNFNPILAAVIAGLFMMITSNMNIAETWNGAMEGVGKMLAVLAPIIVFGGIMGVLYADSGAAASLGKLILAPTRRVSSAAGKRIVAITLFLILRAVIGLSGMDAGALIVPSAALCIAIFAELNIPVKYIPAVSIIGGTLGNVVPAAPSTINVMCEMAIPGFSSSGGMLIRIILVLLLIIGTVVILNFNIAKDITNGEGYTEGGLGKPDLSDEIKRPHWILTLLPILGVYITYNFVPGFEAWSSLLVGTILSIVLFAPYLPSDEHSSKIKSLLRTLDKGSVVIPLQFMVVMFASNVMSMTPGMTTITNGLVSLAIPAAFALLILAAILMGLGGSVSVIAVGSMCTSIFIPMGLTPLACGIITIWAATVLDTLPINNSIFLTCQMVGTDMKRGYPPVFRVSVLLTAVLAILATLSAVAGLI